MADRPIRVQLSRAKGWRMPENTVKVDRTTVFGNLWSHGRPALFNWPMNVRPWCSVQTHVGAVSMTQPEAVAAFRAFLIGERVVKDYLPVELTLKGQESLAFDMRIRRERLTELMGHLRGKNLACWCPIGSPCHADVLLELANAEPEGTR